MFTGLIESTGKIVKIQSQKGGVRYWVGSPWFANTCHEVGASIAVNGVCLTVIDGVEHKVDEAVFDVSNETLNKTTLATLTESDVVNLEAALTLNKPLGGHLVTGHVDGIGKFLGFTDDGEYKIAQFEVIGSIGQFIAHKGSCCIDGISLTTNNIEDQYDDGQKRTRFSVALVPHTLEVTNLGSLNAGNHVNIEVDVIARYGARLTEYRGDVG